MRKEGDDVGVAVPPGWVKEGRAERDGPFLVHSRLMKNPHGTYGPCIHAGFFFVEIMGGMIPAICSISRHSPDTVLISGQWTIKFGDDFPDFSREKSSVDLEKKPDYPKPGAPMPFRSYLSMNFWLYRK